MNAFQEKLIRNELITMGVIKLVFEVNNDDPEDLTLHVAYEHKGDVYVITLGFTCHYKEIGPKYLIEDLKEELRVAKERAEGFEQRNILYIKKRKFYTSGIISYIKWELYGLCDIMKIPFNYTNPEVQKLDKQIEQNLENNISPKEIFDKLKTRYAVNFKTNEKAYEVKGEVEIR